MIQTLGRRWIVVGGLAALGGCATPAASPPPSAKPPQVTVTTAPTGQTPTEEPVALPGVPARQGTSGALTAPTAPTPGAPLTATPGRGPTAQAPGRPITPPPRAGRQIVLNFDNADIEAVIQAASEIAGFSYTIGPGVAGKKVTIQTSGRIPEDEVFNVLLAVLEVNGVTAVRSGNLYKILPTAAVRERPLPTVIGAQAETRSAEERQILLEETRVQDIMTPRPLMIGRLPMSPRQLVTCCTRT